ncbi:unnamed protein product [Miscanthus lutarioriparius]|uniref:Uncharacterized protein n=1 Tax=Miscanthus lutarioriparius TaxID=422564 RepID=A0A811PPR5_9POAL|nr:unnamed protein product [Miscanthus lutarioriparius]
MTEPVRLLGCVSVPGADILQPLQDRASDACRWMVHHGERYRDADGILVNTFDAAEPGAAAVLRRPEPWRPPVYPVGPITRLATTADDGDDTGCVEWLDAQPERSVLFVSFGSGGALSEAQTRELARGLELSGARFLWVVRSPVDADAAGAGANPGESYYDGSKSRDDPLSHLPGGFVERTKATGLVVPSWAPQARVLAHRATMAMLTHCGWNSVLEGGVAAVRRAEAERRAAVRGDPGGAQASGPRRRRDDPRGRHRRGCQGDDARREGSGGARQGGGAPGGSGERAPARRRVLRDTC